MDFKKKEMTREEVIETLFNNDPEFFRAFEIFRKYKVGLTRYDNMITMMKVNVSLVDGGDTNHD
jgi:hypothetical protein